MSAGVTIAGGAFGLAAWLVLGTERVLDFVLVVFLVPVFLYLGYNRAAPDRRRATAKEWRVAVQGCVWPMAVAVGVLVLGVLALANRESVYADVFALLVCLSLVVPGVVLLRMTPGAAPDDDIRIYVFEHGLVDFVGGTATAFRWDTVKLYDQRSGTSSRLRLVAPDGAEVTFVPDDRVRAHVEDGVAEAHGPDAIGTVR
jgi:hypothetical protein